MQNANGVETNHARRPCAGVVDRAVGAEPDLVGQVLLLAVEDLDPVGRRVGDQPGVRQPAGRSGSSGQGRSLLT